MLSDLYLVLIKRSRAFAHGTVDRISIRSHSRAIVNKKGSFFYEDSLYPIGVWIVTKLALHFQTTFNVAHQHRTRKVPKMERMPHPVN